MPMPCHYLVHLHGSGLRVSLVKKRGHFCTPPQHCPLLDTLILISRLSTFLLANPLLFLTDAVVMVGDGSSFGQAGTFLKRLPNHFPR